MEEKRKQAWTEAYKLAYSLTCRQGLETAVLTVGMMWVEVFEKTKEIFFQKSTREP